MQGPCGHKGYKCGDCGFFICQTGHCINSDHRCPPTYQTIIGQTAVDAAKDATIAHLTAELEAARAERDGWRARHAHTAQLSAEASVAELEAALKKIATGTAPEADPDTGELIECWMDADEMREIALDAIRAAYPVTKSS